MKIEVYTDGSSLTNPGIGGWACIIFEDGVESLLQGGEAHTTNNRMELLAVISALEKYKDPIEVTIYCDSAYIVNCFIQKWYVKWRKNNWISSTGEPVVNQDLWVRLLKQVEKHTVTWTKVKGHADNLIHNRCDVMARNAANKQKSGAFNVESDGGKCRDGGTTVAGIENDPTKDQE